MWCNTSIIIGSTSQYRRLQRAVPTLRTHRVAFSSTPTVARRAHPKLHMSRVRVHDAHLHALEYLVKSGGNCAFIFEDDVVPSNWTTHEALRQLMAHLPLNWSYLNMGRCFSRCADEECFAPGLVRHDRSLCRHAYAVRGHTARDLLQHTRLLVRPGDITWRTLLTRRWSDTTFSTTEPWYRQDRATYKSRNGRRDDMRRCEAASPAPAWEASC